MPDTLGPGLCVLLSTVTSGRGLLRAGPRPDALCASGRGGDVVHHLYIIERATARNAWLLPAKQTAYLSRICYSLQSGATPRPAFLNRESEVRILPGALLKPLQNGGKRVSPGVKPWLSDTTLTLP